MTENTKVDSAGGLIPVPHVIKGEARLDYEVEYFSRDLGRPFITPRIEPGELIWPRTYPVPAYDVSSAEVIDILVELGKAINLDTNIYMQEACAASAKVSELGSRIIEQIFRDMPATFDRKALTFDLENQLPIDAVDGWKKVISPDGRVNYLRALPSRLIHVLAGNAPMVAVISLVRSALVRSPSVFKMASNDLFTMSALLRTLAEVAPNHPLTKSFSAVYWRGGDASLESVLYRAQWFDKLVAWGGESAVRNAAAYIGPGFEVVTFDPKISCSLIGREAMADPQTTSHVANAATNDSVVLNQDGCACSRFHYVEGTVEEVDRYCEALAEELPLERRYTLSRVAPVAPELCEELDALKMLEPDYRIWGKYDGSGVVVRSDEPVSFHPDRKIINVVRIDRLDDALKYITTATQTVGIYPPNRIRELRDRLAAAGVQRLFPLGGTGAKGTGDGIVPGLSWDGMMPLQRLVHWINDEGPADRSYDG